MHQNIKLHAPNFDGLISRHGREVSWQEAIKCSCMNPNSGQSNYNCLACRGSGWVYERPIRCKAFVQSVTSAKEYIGYVGMFEVGDALMTVSANTITQVKGLLKKESVDMFRIGEADLVTLIDDEVKVSEVFIRNTPMGRRLADTIVHRYVTRILQIHRHNPENGNTVVYQQGTDYQLQGERIEWIGNQPPEGEKYSVLYMHRPVYTIYAIMPRPRHQDGQELPRTVVMRYLPGGAPHEHGLHPLPNSSIG